MASNLSLWCLFFWESDGVPRASLLPGFRTVLPPFDLGTQRRVRETCPLCPAGACPAPFPALGPFPKLAILPLSFSHRIFCIGAGYVGGPTMAVIAHKCPDVKVTIFDVNQARIDAWNSSNLPIYEPGLQEIVEGVRGRNLFFTTKDEEGLKEADIIFISVNTPTKTFGFGKGRAADLKFVELCARRIGQVIVSCSKTIVEKSTVPVRCSVSIAKILASVQQSGTSEAQFNILSNPEFLAEGTAIRDLLNPDRVLIGHQTTASGQAAADALAGIYSRWVAPEKVLKTNLWSRLPAPAAAVAARPAAPGLRLTASCLRVSSINCVSAICEATGADVDEVARAIGTHSRSGPKFLTASIGFGGSCFQKDIMHLVYLSECMGLMEVADYWRSVITINDYQKQRFARNIVHTMFDTITDKRLAIFGFAFKKDTGDTRESPAIYVCQYLLEEGAKIKIYDPKVSKAQILEDLSTALHTSHGASAQAFVQKQVEFCDSAHSAAELSHAVVVLTEWDEFVALDYTKVYDSMVKPAFLFDGRAILDIDRLQRMGFKAQAIGKPHPETETTLMNE
eukprot:gene9207-1655_t